MPGGSLELISRGYPYRALDNSLNHKEALDMMRVSVVLRYSSVTIEGTVTLYFACPSAFSHLFKID